MGVPDPPQEGDIWGRTLGHLANGNEDSAIPPCTKLLWFWLLLKIVQKVNYRQKRQKLKGNIK